MIKIKEIIDFLNEEKISYCFTGNENDDICGFSSIGNYKPNTMTWLKSCRNMPEALDSREVRLVIKQENLDINFPNMIETAESKRVFFEIIKKFYENKNGFHNMRQNTYIDNSALIGNNVSIGNNVYICSDVTIGDNTVIGNNVSIESRTHIGNNCHIFSGTVIGCVGFGFFEVDNGKYQRVEHFGGVWIGDEVEIGNNCVINRGTIDDTYIGNGVKIDSLRCIPHNVYIGDNCIILGGLGGSCCIGKKSYIAPLTYVLNQVKVGDNCMVSQGVCLDHDLSDGSIAHKNRIIKADYKKILKASKE